jgi:hypothetical protein
VGQDSSVSTVSCYGLDDPGIESQWGGEIFYSHPDQPWGSLSLLYSGYWVFLGLTEPPIQWVPGLPGCTAASYTVGTGSSWVYSSLLYSGYRVFLGVQQQGCGVDHPSPSSTKVKERIELYIYSPSGPSCSVLGRASPS